MMLFYRATGLSGAREGLAELFRPNFTQLYSPDVPCQFLIVTKVTGGRYLYRISVM